MTPSRRSVPWEKLYVFVSSTFRDMHAERDDLVKRVFPQLRDWCERRKLRMIDIDLRWGVTEQDATRHRNVVNVCLSRIDECRPLFFLGFLGQRYGWTVGRRDVSAETFARFPGLWQTLVEERSVTELEILHALISSFHAPAHQRRDGREATPEAFFYLREPSSLAELPDEPYLRQLYTDEAEPDPSRRQLLLERQRHLREVVVPSTERPIRSYRCTWDRHGRTPELEIPLRCSATLPENVECWRELWQRAAGIRAGSLDLAEDPQEAARAVTFNERLTAGRLAGFRIGEESLGSCILRDLERAISARFPEHCEIEEQDDLERELDQQEQFLILNTQDFIEREGDFTGLDSYLEDDTDRPLVLTGPPGTGKSVLLARWIDRVRERLRPVAGASLHVRFVGASDRSTTVHGLLRSLLEEMRAAGKVEAEIADDPVRLRQSWPELLAAAGRHGRTVLVIDALNQIESGLRDTSWLPLALPENLKVVVSFKRAGRHAEALYQRLKASGAVLLETKPFEQLEDRRRLVKSYLSQFLKDLDEQHIEAILGAEGARIPLFLKVVLSELRVFGSFAGLPAKIREDFGQTPETAFDAVLARLEGDPAYSRIDPRRAVPLIFGALAHARRGLSADEATDLLVQALPSDTDVDAWRQNAADSVHLVLRQAHSFLARRGGAYDFFYESFKEAAIRRYVVAETGREGETRASQGWHELLADYFDRLPLWQDSIQDGRGIARRSQQRKVSELPYHLTLARRTPRLEQVLTDLEFIEAKCTAGLIAELVEDYDRIGANPMEPQPPVATARVHQGRTGVHCPFCWGCGEIDSERLGQILPCPCCGTLLRLNPFAREEDWRPAPAQRISEEGTEPSLALASAGVDAFSRFVRTRSHVLARWPFLTFQEAANLGESTPPKRAAVYRQLSGLESRPWLRHLNPSPAPSCLMTLSGHRGTVHVVAPTPDGRRILSCGLDRTVRVWDSATGAQIATLEIDQEPDAMAPIPGTTWVAVGGKRDRIVLWCYESKRKVRELAGLTGGASFLAVSEDGSWIAADSSTKVVSPNVRGRKEEFEDTLAVLRCEDGEILPLRSSAAFTSALALSPDGRFLLQGTSDGTLVFRELRPREVIHSAAAHGQQITAIAVSSDCMRLATASWDSEIKIWDLRNRQELRTLAGHALPVQSVAFSPDGERIVSGSLDLTLKVWDARTGQSLTTLRGHTDPVWSVAFTPDGRWIVSGSVDGTVRIWDPESDRLYFEHSRRNLQERLRAMARGREGGAQIPGAMIEKLLHLQSGIRKHEVFVTQLSIAADSRRIVTGSFDSKIRIWSARTGASEHVLEGHEHGVSSLALSPDSHRIASGDRGMNLKLWDLESGRLLQSRRFGNSKADKKKKGRQLLDTLHEEIKRPSIAPLLFTADGRYLISADSLDPSIKVWSAETLQSVISLQGGAVELRGTPDGRYLVSDGGRRGLRVWDLDSWVMIRIPMEYHRGTIGMGQKGALDLTPDGTRIVCGKLDGTIGIWDLEAGREVEGLRPPGQRLAIASVLVSPNGRRLVSIRGRTLVEVWDLDTREISLSLTFNSKLVTAAWMSDGERIVTGGPHQPIEVWNVSSGGLVARFPVEVWCLDSQDALVAGGAGSGEVYLLELSSAGPRIVTSRALAGVLSYRCPFCSQATDVQKSDLGREVSCSRCHRLLSLNPSTIRELTV